MALSKTTQDHDEIRQWAEARGGKPSEVASTSESGTGILRIEFPGATHANDANLEEISWEQFFEKFDASGLALIYQDVTADGEQSNFNRFAYPENISPSATKSTRKTTARKTAPAKKESAGTKQGAGRKAAPSSKAAQKTAAKKAPGKSTAKTTAKKTSANKTAAKKGASTKTPSKKAAAGRKTVAKKAAAKATGTSRKSTAVKKTPAKKTTRAGAQRAAVAIKKKGAAAKKGGRR